MLNVRQLLFGLFAIATVLVDLSILAIFEREMLDRNSVWTEVIIGTAFGQVGLLGIYLARGAWGLLIRFGLVLAATWLCSELGARFGGGTSTFWYWSFLIHLLSVAIPLLLAKRLRQFTLAGLFSLTTGVCILLGLFRFLDVEYAEHMKPIAVVILLAAVAWFTTWTVSSWKSLWLAVPVAMLFAPAVGVVMGGLLLTHVGPIGGAIAASAQASWLVTGLLIARMTKVVEKSASTPASDADPQVIAPAAASKSDFSPRIW